MGEIASLHSGEILEQVIHARRWANIRNIVFMGMGEPMNNYKNVKLAVGALMDAKYFCLSGKRITVSTVGVSAKSIERFALDLPSVSLAISLHASNQALRERLTPAAKGLPLAKLIAAVDFYISKTNRKVMMEYVMLKDVNDSLATAHELGKLLQGKKVAINLIPYNNTLSSIQVRYEPTESKAIERFKEILIKVYNIYTNVRTEKGSDIASACGQLVVKKMRLGREKDKENGAANGVRDIEELMDQKMSNHSAPKMKLRNGVMVVDGRGDQEDPRVKGFEVYREGFPLWPKDVEKVGKIIKATEEMKMKSMQRLEYVLIASVIFSILFVIFMWYVKFM